MKFYDAKKTVYKIQGHTVKHIPLRKVLKILKFFIKYFLSICAQICRNLRICAVLLKTFLMENLMEKFIFCGVIVSTDNRLYGTKNC